jgi:hypothetical protein
MLKTVFFSKKQVAQKKGSRGYRDERDWVVVSLWVV